MAGPTLPSASPSFPALLSPRPADELELTLGSSLARRWRSGPNGAKTLCNACGLRWAKSQKQAAASSGSSSSGSSGLQLAGGNGGSPLASPSSVLAAFQPMSISPAPLSGQSPPMSFSSLPKVEEDQWMRAQQQ